MSETDAVSRLAERFYVPAKTLDQVADAVGRDRWAPNRSAMELARCWMERTACPAAVFAAVRNVEALFPFEIIKGVFEHGDHLDGLPGPSRTDLMLHIRTSDGLAAVAIEGKVDEGFDLPIRDWRKRTSEAGAARRLGFLCRWLSLTEAAVEDVPYQLLHRTVSALLEANRYGWRKAAVIVQAFTIDNAGCDQERVKRDLTAFGSFAALLGFNGVDRNSFAGPVERHGIHLWIAWIDDRPAGHTLRQA